MHTEASSPRSMAANDLATAAKKVANKVEVKTDPKEALNLALSHAEPEDVVMGTGSLYIVGALREAYLSNQG